MKTSAKLIGNLVHRVSVRLPYKSGKKLEIVEQDPIVKQTVAAIIELSKYKLPTVVNTLGYVLESVSKTHQIFEQNVPVDIMQSKLFVLRLLSACMQHHWQYYRDMKKEENKENGNSDTDLALELPPLDTALVSFILVLMNRYITQFHLIEESLRVEQATNGFSHIVDFTDESGYTYEQIKLSLITDIYQASSRIIYYISASNWDSCYTKIKVAVASLDSANGGSEEIPPDLRILECSCLTKDKLDIIFSELSPSYHSMKVQGKLLFSKMMRKAIWNWIEAYPMQFFKVCTGDVRFLSGPERLFDWCNSTADNSRKKAILWPLQTILLSLSPELLSQAFLDTPSASNRRASFLGLLKKSLQAVRGLDTAAVCYVDLCKAATYVSPDNEPVLRSIVADIEVELKEKVWNFSKPPSSESSSAMLGYTIDQQSLTTDYLLSHIRLHPKEALINSIPSCVEENVPILFKLALVKSCLMILEEENHLSWNPTIESMYDRICTPLRSLFLQTVYQDMNSSANSKKKEVYSTHNNRVELLLDILKMFRIDSKLALLGVENDRVDQISAFVVGLAMLAQHSVQTIRQRAAELLLKMHQPENIAHWCPTEDSNLLPIFWTITSPVVSSLANQMLDRQKQNSKMNEDGIRSILALLIKLLKIRNSFLKSKQFLIAPENCYMRERLQATVELEIALLVSLNSADKEVCDEATKCIGLLCKEANMVQVDEEGGERDNITLACNIKIYEELSKDDSRFIGRKAQQKRIRKYLRMMPHHTPGNLDAWTKAFTKWKKLVQEVTRLSDEISDDGSMDTLTSSNGSSMLSSTLNISSNNSAAISNSDRKKLPLTTRSDKNARPVEVVKPQPSLTATEDTINEWQNFTGFLAALGGCCLQEESGDEDESNPNTKMVERYMSDMIKMLVSENVHIRESVKDTLGNDLSPTLYVILFNHLEEYMDGCFDSKNDPVRSPKNKLFVEQALLVLRLILERLVNPGDYLLNIDFSNLIQNFVNYLSGLPDTDVTLRVKIKMCLLVETVMIKKEHIILRAEIRLRNKLLGDVIEWTSDFSGLRKQTEKSQQTDQLQRDLDQACLKAIVSLLIQLPLQPSEAVRPAEISEIKSKMFLKYFNFFRKLLDRYKQTERGVAHNKALANNSQNGYSSSRDSMIKTGMMASPSDMYTDWGHMKELTILAMSHLLSANVDAGLKYSLSMGYDDDQEMRTAFMQVLTNILNQGTEFETLAESVMTDRYEKLIEMIVDADMEIVMSLCEVCPSADTTGVAEILLICFESRYKVMPLLKAVLRKEIALTEQEATLFRGTTMATRILSIYAKLSCLDYIRITLQPAMEEINLLSDDKLTWELDPLKLQRNEDVLVNKKNIIRATEILLKAICSSVDSAPRAFREELALICEAVGERFPEAKTTAVGSFVFLRLFGPSILTPENAGFAKHVLPRNTSVRKILLQATRVMQNLANNVLFGSKETHMIVLNDFLTGNIYKVTNFLRIISTVSIEDVPGNTGAVRMDQTGYLRLHKYLSDNLERMSRNLTGKNISKQTPADSRTFLDWKKTLDRLSTLLAQLGRPSDISSSELMYTRNYAFVNSNHSYSEFMRRNNHRDLAAAGGQAMFYLGGKSKAGRPVFYMTSRLVDAEQMDGELFVYYMLRVMEPYLNSPFELLFDTTEFCSHKAIPADWFAQFLQLVFNEMNDYLVVLHLHNPSMFLQNYIRKLPRATVNKLIKRVRFSSSIAEIYEFIHPNELKLTKESFDMDKDQGFIIITQVTRISHMRSAIPVYIKFGMDYCQIITVKKHEVIYNISSIVRDVLHISDISDIRVMPSAKPENGGEFSFKYDKGNATMILSSTKRDYILDLLRTCRQRYDASKPTVISDRAIRPNDVPGRLLNMALLNVGSEDPSLRIAAYNLLYSLSLSFRFNIGNQLLNAKDLCIPSNSSDFIVSISESLAQSEIHLTLEFLNEAFVGFLKSNESMRQLCLDYLSPWLKNLAIYARHTPDEQKKNTLKTKDMLKILIDLTIRQTELYKHIQVKIWKTLAEVDDLVNLVIDSFVQYSIENGIGSVQSEIIADTLVTMSSVSIRGKIISRMRRVIEGTAIQPCRRLVEHPSWNEIAVLLRFILMLSFNNTGPVMPYIPEIFHIVSILVVTGPTLIRCSVHELVVNTIHTLCTMGIPLTDDNVKKLHFVLSDVCDSKNRVSFGLTKQHANAFTITKETTEDFAESVDLSSLQNIVKLLLDALNFGAPTVDIANMWRARWMSLVTSTAFYFNPAIQPRSFVTLGCLAQEEVDDDLIYQILVALKGALAIFNESDSSLITSIMMCLSNVIENLPSDSRYIVHLFWLAIALIQVGNPVTFQTSVQFLQSVLRALDSRKLFIQHSIEEVFLRARDELGDVAVQLDDVCGISFNNYFSFAVSVILLKGLKHCDNKDIVFQCLSSFLEIDCKQRADAAKVEARTLGYFIGLLPFAAKDDTLRELLRLAGLSEVNLDRIDFASDSLFNVLDIPDNSTALVLISFLVTLLNASENESEKLFLYTILADAADSVPDVFALVYESLLPKMNQMVVNSQNQDVIEAVKRILLTACSEPAFHQASSSSSKRTQKWGLDNLKFSSLNDPTFGAIKTNIALNASLASKLLEAITDQR